MTEARDLLVVAKTVAANDFPVERPSVIGVDRETGTLLRVSPFPWKANDTDPPLLRWSWVRGDLAPAPLDPRPDARVLEGEAVATAYVDAKDGWRLRWPFVRPHVAGSLEAFLSAAREGGPTAGFVQPVDFDVIQLPLRARFRCGTADCAAAHELPVLDWEMHEMARLVREREGARWATVFRERWGAGLAARFDLRLLVSTYAQAPGRTYVAGIFTPPREAEDAHVHAHHMEHRAHR
ncbi:MAG: hypothetical protein FJ034_06400 [Chloroflexi bacterium]|nr:hypothetical protein [Chloroflexota bacterium]